MSKEIMLRNIEKAQRAIDGNREAVKGGKMRQRYHFMGEAAGSMTGSRQDKLVLGAEGTEVKAGDGVSFELKFKIDLENTDADKLLVIIDYGLAT